MSRLICVRRCAVAAISYCLLLTASSPASAQDCGFVDCGDEVCDLGCGDSCTGCDSCGANGCDRFWVRGEFLYWQVTGAKAPPLVTSSPAGTPLATAGRLGLPTTTVIVGDDELNDGWRPGFAVAAGYWLDPACGLAVVGDYMNLNQDEFNSTIGPSGAAIFARPFFNDELGVQDAELVDVPNQLSGSAHIQSRTEFQGAGLGLEKCLWSCGDSRSCGMSGWLTMVGGYRYYQHGSLLQVNEDLVVLPGTTSPLVPGTHIQLEDKFGARNQFHGGELGLQGRLQQGFVWFDGLAALAVGGNMRDVSINGGTDITVPAGGFTSNEGGLLTSSVTNIGNYSDTKATVIPRFRLGVGCQLSQRLSARVGYNVIVWNDAVQAASQLPPGLTVDPRNLPPVQPGGGSAPANPGMFGTTVVAHGADVGLEFTF